jgi:thiol-disulfide isomerase/thioredoxin
MHTRTLAAAGLLAASLVLSGCATPPGAAPTGDSGDPSPTSPSVQTPDASASSTGAYLDYTDGAIEATAGPKVLFFHASWCPQCRQLDEQLVAEGAPDGLTVFKVDYDSRTDLRQRYGVTLQTTVVFVDDRGEAIASSVLYDDPSIASLVAAMP